MLGFYYGNLRLSLGRNHDWELLPGAESILNLYPEEEGPFLEGWVRGRVFPDEDFYREEIVPGMVEKGTSLGDLIPLTNCATTRDPIWVRTGEGQSYESICPYATLTGEDFGNEYFWKLFPRVEHLEENSFDDFLWKCRSNLPEELFETRSPSFDSYGLVEFSENAIGVKSPDGKKMYFASLSRGVIYEGIVDLGGN